MGITDGVKMGGREIFAGAGGFDVTGKWPARAMPPAVVFVNEKKGGAAQDQARDSVFSIFSAAAPGLR